MILAAPEQPGVGPLQLGFVQNGRFLEGSGMGGTPVQKLIAANGDTNVLRPYFSDDPYDPNSYVINWKVKDKDGNPQVLVTNNPASLRFQDWRLIDEAIIRVSKPRLRAVGDLRGNGLEVSLANGMAFPIFSYERQSDISPASINMDGIVQGDSDRPVFDILNLPLPIIHKDFQFPARQVMASRNGFSPLDTTTAELAARRVAEAAEQLLLGVLPSYTYGGGTIYGYTNFPQRLTKTMTSPTAAGWTPATTIDELLAMRTQSQLAYHFGPWMIYNSTNWDQYLDKDYSSAKGDWTLRQRIEQIDGFLGCRTLDYFQFQTNNPYTMIMVQMTNDVIREVIGLDITTLQWESHAGMQLNFKVMCIMVPQLRADQNGNSGICHGSATYP